MFFLQWIDHPCELAKISPGSHVLKAFDVDTRQARGVVSTTRHHPVRRDPLHPLHHHCLLPRLSFRSETSSFFTHIRPFHLRRRPWVVARW